MEKQLRRTGLRGERLGRGVEIKELSEPSELSELSELSEHAFNAFSIQEPYF